MASILKNKIEGDKIKPKKRKKGDNEIKFYGYCRTSKETSDIENQEFKIKQYCELNDIKLDELIKDDSVSGYKTDAIDRGFYDLVTRKCYQGDTVVIYCATRIARKNADVHALCDLCQQLKVILISVNFGFKIDGSILSIMFVSNLALMSQLEREFISMRTKAKLEKLNSDIKGGIETKKKPRIEEEEGNTYDMIGICGTVRVITDEKGEKKQVLRKGTKYNKDQAWKDRHNKIVEMLKAGIKKKDIAKEFKWPASTLSVYLRNNGSEAIE